MAFSPFQLLLVVVAVVLMAVADATPPGIVKNPSHATCKIKKFKHCYNLVHVCPKFCPDQCTVECASCKPICGDGSNPPPDNSPPATPLPPSTPSPEPPSPPPATPLPPSTPSPQTPPPATPLPPSTPSPRPPSSPPATPLPPSTHSPQPPSPSVPFPPTRPTTPTQPSSPPPAPATPIYPPTKTPPSPPTTSMPPPPPPPAVNTPTPSPPPATSTPPPTPDSSPAPRPPSKTPSSPPPATSTTPPSPKSPHQSPPPSSPSPSTPGTTPAPSPPDSSAQARKRVRCRNVNFPQCYNMIHTCPTVCPDGCEVDCVTCKPVCKCDRPGAVCQDPRFVGGDGITFYFHGKKDNNYCLVSDPNLHINAHFIGKRNQNLKRDFTWVQSLGILFDNRQLFIGAQETAAWDDSIDRLSVALDGRPIALPELEGARWQSSGGSPSIFIVRLAATNSIMVEAEGLFRITTSVVAITEEDSRIHNYEITKENSFAHLDVRFKFFSLSGKVGGVLGQTYSSDYTSHVNLRAKMPVMGRDEEFETSSLFAADCTVARFRGRGGGGSGEEA